MFINMEVGQTHTFSLVYMRVCVCVCVHVCVCVAGGDVNSRLLCRNRLISISVCPRKIFKRFLANIQLLG